MASPRFSIALQDSAGNAESGCTVELCDSDGYSFSPQRNFNEIGTSGVYYIEVDSDIDTTTTYSVKIDGSINDAFNGILIPAADIETHIADATKHRLINDSSAAASVLWSASKINTELKDKAEIDDTMIAGDLDSESTTWSIDKISTELDLKSDISDIVNTLTSTETAKPLAAAQGKTLKDAITLDTISSFLDDSKSISQNLDILAAAIGQLQAVDIPPGNSYYVGYLWQSGATDNTPSGTITPLSASVSSSTFCDRLKIQTYKIPVMKQLTYIFQAQNMSTGTTTIKLMCDSVSESFEIISTDLTTYALYLDVRPVTNYEIQTITVQMKTTCASGAEFFGEVLMAKEAMTFISGLASSAETTPVQDLVH